jgi:hypothetical protein
MKLYELTAAYASALELFTDPEQHFDDDLINDTLESIELSFDDKVIQIASVIKSMQAEADAIKTAISSMSARQKSLENRADDLKAYLLRNMKSAGIKQVKSPWLVVNMQKSPVSVNVINESEVPVFYKTEVVTVKIDKTAIKNAWRDNYPVSGCELVQGEHLRIK